MWQGQYHYHNKKNVPQSVQKTSLKNGKNKEAAIRNTKRLLASIFSGTVEDQEVIVKNVDATAIKDKFVNGPLLSVEIRGTFKGQTLSFLCVTNLAGKVLKVGKPLNDSKINLKLFQNGNKGL